MSVTKIEVPDVKNPLLDRPTLGTLKSLESYIASLPDNIPTTYLKETICHFNKCRRMSILELSKAIHGKPVSVLLASLVDDLIVAIYDYTAVGDMATLDMTKYILSRKCPVNAGSTDRTKDYVQDTIDREALAAIRRYGSRDVLIAYAILHYHMG